MTERVAPELEGYRGMGPVRIGNAAALQNQHDVYGSVILAASQMFYDARLQRVDGRSLFHELELLGEHAAALALEPDAGLWEFRGRRGIHTFSSVMCWVACGRLAKISGHLGIADRAMHWDQEAKRIREQILSRAWNAAQSTLVDALDGTEVDASLLLLNEVGFLTADDPRFLGTLAAIEQKLKRGTLLFRYGRPDDFGPPQTAFTVCTFWYIDALAAAGRREEARVLFEQMLAHRNHLGLLSQVVK